MRRAFLIAIPYVWLLALFLVPFLIVFKISLSDTALARPPYLPVFDWAEGVGAFLAQLDFENFVWLTSDDLYWKAYLSSLQIAVVATFFTLLIGYPIAYAMARSPEAWRPTLMMLVILPFWTSFLIRIYAWMGILSQEGFLNQFLLWTGLISVPLTILNTNVAVYIGVVYTYLPFMILPIYAALERLDGSLIEAAEDLGCSRLSAFWLVTIPLSKNGIIAGCFLVFIPVLGEFVIPSLLGGSGTLMIGKVLRLSWFNVVSLTVGFAFLYIPMLILVIYSFNESKLVTVWAGFSTKWYGELMQNEAFLKAAWVTVKVAILSSTIATILGTMAAYVLIRSGRFFGRTLFSGMIYAPLVMPEVMAHATFSMCYVSVVVSSRLMSFDRSLEEAALDLGCTPFEAFRLVTLPIIAPSVIAGWLLAFSLSLDDLVIASFTSGPSATTLPIKIFSAVRLGVSPEINALSTIMIAIVTVGVITGWHGAGLLIVDRSKVQAGSIGRPNSGCP